MCVFGSAERAVLTDIGKFTYSCAFLANARKDNGMMQRSLNESGPEKLVTGPWEVAFTEERVRADLSAAMDTLRRLRMPRHGVPPKLRSAMPEPIRTYWEAYGQDPGDRPALPAPSPSAISRMDRVLPWLFWVEGKRLRSAVCLRALGLSWRRIAAIIGDVSHETVRGWETTAIRTIVARLNRERNS